MNLLNLITDGYERKARLYPALLLLAPVLVTFVAIISARISALQSLTGVIVGCGGAFLLSQLARDAGKNGEKALFEKWAGPPSVAIFRHRDTRLDAITKARYHKKLVTLVRGAKAPSTEGEEADPAGADQVYAAWSTYLRVNTRNTKKHSLLFKELVNYGYRRNVRGLRTIGIVASGLSCAVAAGRFFHVYGATGKVSEEIVGAFAFGLVFLLLWIFRFSSDWVRIPADAYAERLAETVETISSKTSALQ